MKRRIETTVGFLLILGTVALAQTQNSYPMLMSLKPVAVQAGATTECEVSSRYTLAGATRVLVSGEGVTGEVVPPEEKPEADKPAEPKGKRARRETPKIKLKFTVAADAMPGPRDFRLATPQGASTTGQLVVVRDPIISETGDNDTIAKAQAITLPCTLCGAIEKAEDVDCIKFTVEAGAALTFHVRAMRLEDRIHDLQEHVDPIITLRTAAGSTLAAADNYFAADPLLYHKFEQAGEYVLEIRDVRFKGNADWVYCVEINSRPFITQATPLAIAPGVETKLALVGYNLPADATATVSVPAGTPPGLRSIAPTVGGQPANPIAIFVSSVPTVTKLAPPAAAPAAAPVANPPATTNATPPAAPVGQPITIPAAVSGTIEKPGDADRFTFDAKAGDKLTFEVVARRAGSAIDSILRILNDKGAAVSEADDSTHDRVTSQDSWLENWSAPADGKFTIEIRDLHLRGGPQFTYAIAVSRAEPHFLLEIDTDKTQLAPGIGSPIYVRVLRKNGFAGEVALAVDGLPPGVTATCGRILTEGRGDGCIILTAAADAPAGVANIKITGTAKHPRKDPADPTKDAPPLDLAAVARTFQEYYSPGGGRGNYPVEMHTVSVAEPKDIRSVKLSTAAITLKPGESQKIEVTIERAPDMKQNVSLDVLYQHLEQPYGNSLPKGVTLDIGQSKTLLTGEETKGWITLTAAADAPAVENQLVPAMAHVSINFVMKATYCEPLSITVAPAK